MKTMAATVALLLGAAGLATAQDDRERKMDELKREFDRTLRGLQQKFDSERERLEKEFKAARERLLEQKGERREDDRKPRDVESLLRDLVKRVDSLEKRLDGGLPRLRELPGLRELPRLMPPEFDFKRLEQGVPEEWRRWLEQMPRFRGGEDYKFEFRKAPPKGDDDPENVPKEKKDKSQPRKKDENSQQY